MKIIYCIYDFHGFIEFKHIKLISFVLLIFQHLVISFKVGEFSLRIEFLLQQSRSSAGLTTGYENINGVSYKRQPTKCRFGFLVMCCERVNLNQCSLNQSDLNEPSHLFLCFFNVSYGQIQNIFLL